MTLSPILPAHDADTIALDLGVFIAERARTYRVSQAAVIAALRPLFPSQPGEASSAHAPAAQTDGEGLSSSQSSSPSVEPSAPLHFSDHPTGGENEGGATEAGDEVGHVAMDAADHGRVDADAETQPAGGENVDAPDVPDTETVCNDAPEHASVTGKSVEPSGSAAPVFEVHQQAYDRVRLAFEANPSGTNRQIARAAKCNAARANAWLKQLRLDRAAQTTAALAGHGRAVRPPPTSPEVPPSKRDTIKSKVWAIHYEHPDWNAQQIADHLGAKKGSVAGVLIDARRARNAELAIVEPAPVPNPQKPVAAPPPPTGGTLAERVKILHEQHPTWTGRMIANELGANVGSVSVALSKLRNPKASAAEAAQNPQFSGRRDMINHYSEVAKRLGKAS